MRKYRIFVARLLRLLFLLLTIITAQTVFGQHGTFTIQGTVTDQRGQAVELATVSAPKGAPCSVRTIAKSSSVDAAK